MELGKTLAAAKQDVEAKNEFEAARIIFERLEENFPDNQKYHTFREEVEQLLKTVAVLTHSEIE